MTRFPLPILAIVAAFAASPAAAHLDPVAHGSFVAGVTHPVFGADHILAMLCVGLWAVVLGGKALWSLPLGFVSAVAVGFVLSRGGLLLPMVEPVILASVIALGVLVASAARVAMPVAVVTCAGFGLFHGYAHGAEIGGAAAYGYLGGLVAATVALHAGAVVFGLGLARLGQSGMARTAGGVVAVAGSAIVLGG